MENNKKWHDKIGKRSTNTPNKPASKLDNLIRGNKDLCYKVVGKDSTGREAYYFVLIDKNKKEIFLSKKVGDTYNLEEFGKIIYSSYGSEVPEDVKIMLNEQYGFDV